MLSTGPHPTAPSIQRRAELIEWLRYAPLASVLDEATTLLAAGTAEDDLWAANALTACRYVNNQAHNLLGFVSHAMIGCEDARRLAAGQPQQLRHLLLLQALYQTALDLHDPCFSPWELLPFSPLRGPDPAAEIGLLRTDIRFGEYMRADHRFVGLAETLPARELIDLMLEIGLEGITTDDHTLISPVLSLGLVELVGWEAGFDLLRWAVRYSASFPLNRTPFGRAVELVRHYELDEGVPPGLQPELVQPLRAALMAATPAARPELIAAAMAERGCSAETAVAAAAYAACDMYLRVDPVPHADFDAISREVAPIHIGNAMRQLRNGLKSMRPATQALAAIQAGSLLERGPSVLDADFCFVAFAAAPDYPYAADVAQWATHTPARLLASLYDALHAHDCRNITALVHAYADQAAPPAPLIELLTAVAATDNGTLLHNVKHLNSMVREFHASDHRDRWNFLIQAAKFVGWYAGLTTEGYARASAAMEAHPFN